MTNTLRGSFATHPSCFSRLQVVAAAAAQVPQGLEKGRVEATAPLPTLREVELRRDQTVAQGWESLIVC